MAFSPGGRYRATCNKLWLFTRPSPPVPRKRPSSACVSAVSGNRSRIYASSTREYERRAGVAGSRDSCSPAGSPRMEPREPQCRHGRASRPPTSEVERAPGSDANSAEERSVRSPRARRRSADRSRLGQGLLEPGPCPCGPESREPLGKASKRYRRRASLLSANAPTRKGLPVRPRDPRRASYGRRATASPGALAIDSVANSKQDLLYLSFSDLGVEEAERRLSGERLVLSL